MDESLLAEHVDAIHGVPPDDFVAERDRRVKQLRADGHREEASALKAHRKPTLPAWAVNQLARRDPAAVDELVQAGGALRTAQLRATSGKGADGLRPATHRVRDLATDLARSARDILDMAGASTGHLEEVQQTLFAAAIDPDLQERLCRGVFTRPVEATGFGVVEGLVAVPDQVADDPDEDVTDRRDTDEDEEAAREREQRRQREEEQARREARRRGLERQRGDLQQSLVRQQRRVERARERADDLQARADRAAAEAHEQAQESDRMMAEVEAIDEELAALEADGTQD